MRSSPHARAAFLLLYGALLAWQIERWCFTPYGIVSTWAGRGPTSTVTAASTRGVTQTFTMGADGLDGVWLRTRVAGGTPGGELLVDLLALTGEHRIRIERVAVPAAAVPGAGRLHVPFRLVKASRGVRYQLDVRHVHPADGPPIELAVTRDDGLRTGRLSVDGREQWGDLVFETSSRRATLPFWLHEILRPWPDWVHRWPLVVLALLAFNLVLGWACARAVGLGGASAPVVDVVRRSASARSATVPVATATVLLITVAGAAVAGRPIGRYRSLDLIAALPDAAVQTTWASLHEAVSPEPVLIAGRIHRGLVAMPPSTIAWTVDVPGDAVLRLGAAMRPDMWERQSDGIQMRVHIDHAGGRTTPHALTLFPLGVPEHRRLFPLEVPLHPWAGQRITIVLETAPERWGNAVNDVPVWTDPRIEWSRHPAAGMARTIPTSQ